MNIQTGVKGTIKPSISQRDLDRLMSALGGARQVEDIYPLSPLQHGMLFHCLHEPQSSVYLTTHSCRLSGALDAVAFARAWQMVVERHAVLRTAFVGQDLDMPLQVVLRGRALGCESHDWRDRPPAEQAERFVALQQAERERGFDFTAPPLMRLALIRLTSECYRLIWTAHHLLLDGWSVQNVLGEVFAAYAALVRDAPPQLGRVRPYRDYIAWLRRQNYGAAEAYWHDRLAGLGGPTPLGIERGRSGATAADHHAEHMLALPAGAGARLEAWARRHKLTMSTLVQGAWALLLARYGGTDDVVFGVTVSGRPAELTDVERMVGLFVNTLPLRITVGPEQTTVDWLRQVHAWVSELIDYQYTPLTELQRWSGLSAATPLFDSILVFENYPSATAETSLRIDDPSSIERTNYPLTAAFLTGPSPALKLIYDTNRFKAAAIERLAGHFARLLEELVADPARRLSEVSLLSEAERHELVTRWNDTAAAYPKQRCLHELFAEQATHTPDAPALIFRDQALSYGALAQHANQVAHYLRRHGVGPDTVVGLCVERSPAMIIGVLGILKAGGAYLPLDPSYPAERLGYMLADSGARVLVTQDALAERLPKNGAHVVRLDADAAAIAREPVTSPQSDVDPDNLAYVIYTSGSTGRAKGVATVHRNVVRLVKGANYVAITHEVVFLQLAPLAFDASTFEIWGALLNGARLVLYPDEPVDIARLRQVIAESGVSVLWLTAGLFHQVVDEDVGALAPVRQLLAGGDVLSPAHVKRVLAALPGCQVINGYGPTEGTTFTTTLRVADASFDGSVAIGRPISNTQVYVLDDRLALVPAGTVGELHVGGAGLARGYLGRPGLTAERFLPSPFASGERLYATGDLVRWRADGNLEFLGRRDTQVKIRGFRIEPGEVETALIAHAAVQQAAVVARADGAGAKRLVAYLVPAAGATPDLDDLRAHLGRTLPGHMMPQAFVTLMSFPLTPNGKLDRKALPAPDAPASADYVAPRNEIEAMLARLFAEVLGHARVGIHDNFFELGGDSILSIQLAAQAGRDGVKLTTRQIFERQTIAELAAVTPLPTAASLDQDVDRDLPQGEVPLTPIQHWFFAQKLYDPSHFNQAVLLECRGLAPAFVAQAIGHLIRHHDALRLRFDCRDSVWRQAYVDADDVPFAHIDLTHVDPAAQSNELAYQIDKRQESLNISSGPLLQAALVDLGARGQRLLLVIHHLVVDGVSWRILLEDLHTAYERLARGVAVRLPAKTTSFKRWAERLVAEGRSEESRREIAWWQAQPWSTAEPLPVDLEGANTVAKAATVSDSLEIAETQALLQRVPAPYRTQINDVLLTALAQAVAGWTGTHRLLVDLEGHGREELGDDADLSRTVGWFTSLFPVLLDLAEAGDRGSALTSVKEQLRAIPRRGIGYGILKYLSGLDVSAAPQPQISFNYLGQVDQSAANAPLFRLASESSGLSENPYAARPHLIDVTAMVVDGRLRLHWTYCKAIHSAATIEQLSRRYIECLRELIAHCLTAVGGFTPSDFPLVGLDASWLDVLQWRYDDIEDVLPLSPLQAGLLFHALEAPESGAYHEQLCLTVDGEVDSAALEAAWRALLARHAGLRVAVVDDVGPVPLQVVRRNPSLAWRVDDWSGLEPARFAAHLDELLAADRARGFDLASAPLLRVCLLRSRDHHLLIVSYHHLLLDGWSMPIVLGELLELYAAARRGAPEKLPAVRPYRDYLAWLARQDRDAAQAFWRTRLARSEPCRLAPSRPADGAAEPRDHDVAVTSDLAGRLQSFAQSQRVTVNTLVQGAWALLLGRYGGRSEVVFGMTTAGRPGELAGVERMVGLFINTLPRRIALDHTAPVGEWLRALQSRQAEEQQHGWCSLVDIQRESGIASREGLFDTLVVFENYPVAASLRDGAAARAAGLRVTSGRTIEQVHYPLYLAVTPGAAMALRFGYRGDLFDASMIERLAGHFVRLLEELVADPARRLSEVSLLGEAERYQLVRQRNDTAVEYPQKHSLHELFAEQAEHTPEAPALIFRDQALSYGALAQHANQVAHYLRRHGVGPDTVVGLCVERSPAMIIGVLGILKAGGAYLPLDPSYPAERLGYMLADSGARVLVTQDALTEQLPVDAVQAVHVVRLDADAATIAREPVTPPPSDVHPDNLVYVIYTSGSSGRPKGVATVHRNVVRLIKGASYVAVTPEDVFLQLAPLAFDASTFEIWGALLNGARLVLYPDEPIDIARLRQVISEAGVSILWLTSGLFHQVVDANVGTLAPVRQLLAGGDALSPAHVKRVLEALPGCVVINGYGPTEGTTFTTTFRVPDGSFEGSVAIGQPIANTQVYVLDDRLELAPTGAVGGLYVGGAGLARGYLGRPGLTAERFVPSPFAAGERLYDTGDLVRWRTDGQIEFLGRRDTQVKLRGFRIEPGEIEAALTAHVDVEQAAVVARADDAGAKRLVAYVVPAAGSAPDADDLRAHLKRTLPDHMVPQAYVTLASFPLTPNGKLDRRALPAPDTGASADYVAPRNEIEATLARLFAEVLGRERVGIHDNFFELGGHSLLAMQLINVVRAAFALSLSVRSVFECPTVAELAIRTEEALARDIDAMTSEQIEAELARSVPPDRPIDDRDTDQDTDRDPKRELVHG